MISRRAFIRGGSFALVSLGFAPSFLARTAFAAAPTRRAKRLIAIFQRGAVDGLSVVVPFGDADYYKGRPTLAIGKPTSDDATTAIDLDGFFALNPRMAVLKPLWDQKSLAVVHACGSPDATRSHFDAQDYMETATPGVKNTGDGWLNRYLQARTEPAAPFRAVALTAQLPRALQGKASTLAVQSLEQFGLRGNQTAPSFESQYAAAADQILNGTGREAFDAMRTMKASDPTRYRPEHGAEYPRSAFGQSLRQIAQLIKADLGLEVAFAEVGGWDTHVNQGSTQGLLGTRLDDFARSIAALTTDLGDRLADTVIITMSEFGRAVRENGNRGTDHGHGNAMMVIGGPVRGGRVYGRWPGLGADQRYQGRDLAITTDFRDVFGEIVARHLGVADLTPIFPGYRADEARFPGVLEP